MNQYIRKPDSILKKNDIEIAYFTDEEATNLDKEVISDFGEEWLKFSSFSEKDLSIIGDGYFRLLDSIGEPIEDFLTLDVGCGTGRWSYYLADKVKFIEAIDPSDAVLSAAKMLRGTKNVRVTKCDLESIPFQKESFDLVYSLGVLHHIPDTAKAIKDAVSYVKPNKYFLVYLYYAFDNRGPLFKGLFKFSDLIRKVVSSLPSGPKKIICDILALFIYLPLVSLIKLGLKIFPNSKFFKKMPLAVYAEHESSFQILRNDSLDRFGTKLEQRFTRKEITAMMKDAGLENITFSDSGTLWVAIGQKK